MIQKFFWATIFCSFSVLAFSQQKSILKDLRTHKVGQGRVEINQSPLLDSIMSEQLKNAHLHVVTEDEQSFVVGRGYRIQIFSGNNQRLAKTEAYDKKKELEEVFPELETYVTFQSPFWKLRVGNYRTSEEAHAALRMLKSEFPRWNEMFITHDIIKFPLENNNIYPTIE